MAHCVIHNILTAVFCEWHLWCESVDIDKYTAAHHCLSVAAAERSIFIDGHTASAQQQQQLILAQSQLPLTICYGCAEASKKTLPQENRPVSG